MKLRFSNEPRNAKNDKKYQQYFGGREKNLEAPWITSRWENFQAPRISHWGRTNIFYVPHGINNEAPLKTDLLLIYIISHWGRTNIFYVPHGINNEAPLKTDLLLIYIIQDQNDYEIYNDIELWYTHNRQ